MTNLTLITLDNWKENLKSGYFVNRYIPDIGDWVKCLDRKFEYFIDDIDQLLTLQKQAIKNEAVRRIEEEKIGWTDEGDNIKGMTMAQDIIRNID